MHGESGSQPVPLADPRRARDAGDASPLPPVEAEEPSVAVATEPLAGTEAPPDEQASEHEEQPEPPEPPRRPNPWVVRLPLILVGLTVVFNLWALHPNAYTTTYA